MDEQRQYPGIDTGIDVEYNMSRGQDWFNTDSRDLGCSGICIIIRTSFLPGPVLDPKFKLPDSTRVTEATGEIVWQEYIMGKGYIATGIRFTEIKSNGIELINKYIGNAAFILTGL